MTDSALRNAPMIEAALGGRPARRPVWIMRQAGRYLPEYRKVRERLSFLELCDDPEAAAEVTLQPLRRFDLDAAILFTDLLIPARGMGLGLRYDPGPRIDAPVRSRRDVDALAVPDPERDLGAMLATARLVREALAPEVALIGFVGAPFTFACYLVEGQGSKTWDKTRRLMEAEPATFGALLDRIADALEPLVLALRANGCDAIQVFDSWAGVLPTGTYAELCAPRTDRLLRAARDAGAVTIDFVNGAFQHLDAMNQSSAHVLGVDWRHDMAAFRAHAAPDKALQGNLDPAVLFGDEARLRDAVRAVCEGAGGDRHIFNLGHGIWPDTDPRALEIVVEEVRRS